MRRLSAYMSSARMCCTKECAGNMLRRPGGLAVVVQWRQRWDRLKKSVQHETVLQSLWRYAKVAAPVPFQTSAEADAATRDRLLRGSFQYHFLGIFMCRRAWQTLTGVSSWVLVAAGRRWARGERSFSRAGKETRSPLMTQMSGALWALIESIQEKMPLKDVPQEHIIMPFHHQIMLFRMLQDWYLETLGDSRRPPLLPSPPNLQTFKAVMRWPQYQNVKFHRHVEMGRCPTCALLRYKCASSPPETRAAWQALAAKHQWLQRAQKEVYARDRAVAAATFPSVELYMAFDGGSGSDYVFPHLSASDWEGPTKALALQTVPLKVMNGLVHGDHRSHVILSPGVIVAGGCHTCESIAISVNTVFAEHGDVPRTISVQLDNASTNHNILVLAFGALYVLEDVCSKFRVRFELENHAHDIYDSFHAIHTRKVASTTFFTWNELVRIICEAHGDPRDHRDPVWTQPSSMMGHDVMVSNLWDIRDFWEWLAPDYRIKSAGALSRGAFVAYDQISDYHDFVLQLEPNSTSANRRVGLWAKRYMSDPDSDLRYLGTMTTAELFATVVGDRRPPPLQETTKSQKLEVETGAMKHFKKVINGPFNEQLSAERLADAMALCARNYAHFAEASGQMPADGSRQWLPSQLGAALRQAGKRGGPIQLPSTESPHGTAAASLLARCVIKGRLRKHARQLAHSLADAHGLRRGRGTETVARYGTLPKTEQEFQARRPAVGGFAATPPAAHSHFVRSHPELADAPFWVWRILKTYQSGDAFPVEVSGQAVAAELTYEAQLYKPTAGGKFEPLWDVMPIAAFLRTGKEKAKRRLRRLRAHGVISKSVKKVKAPLVAYLRDGNVIGGGFALTSKQKVSNRARRHLHALGIPEAGEQQGSDAEESDSSASR